MFFYIVYYWRMECMYGFISQVFVDHILHVSTMEMTKMDSYSVENNCINRI